jgi:hypothetical protein
VGLYSSAGGFGRRRGFGRAATALALAFAALCVASGCGGSGRGAETDPEKGSDAAILNEALSRELTMLDAYTRGRLLLHGARRALGRQLRAHEQEYIDALTKGIRGLGGDTEAEPEDLDLSGVEDQAAFLALAYELESAALAFYVEVAPRLYTAAPRTLDASLAAGHAQHLVVLRQALGAGAAASIPEGFDGGEVPAPARIGPGGRR